MQKISNISYLINKGSSIKICGVQGMKLTYKKERTNILTFKI